MPDGLVSAVDALRLVIATSLIFILPGAAWHLVFWPRGADIGRLERLALVATTAYLITGAGALALARVTALRAEPLAIALAAVVAAGIIATLVTGRWRRPASEGEPSARPDRLGDVVFVVVTIVLTVGIVIAPQVIAVFPDGTPIGTITWYYWGLTAQMVDAARIPAESAEWGASFEFQGDYVWFNAASAVLPILGGRASDFLSMEILRVAGLAWAVVAALGMFRRFLPRYGALIGTLLFFSAIHVVSKYTGYRPESFNYALIFFAVWAVDRFGDRQVLTRGALVVAAIVALWVGHGVVLVLGGLLAGGVVVGRWFVERPPTVRSIVLYGAVLIAGFGASILTDLVLQGKVLLIANAVDPGPIQGGTSSDLTWQFRQWALGGRHLLTGDPSDAEVLFTRRITEPWAVVNGMVRWLVLAIAIVPPLLGWRWLSIRARALWVGAIVYLVGLAVVVLAFLTLYDTYVPQRVGFGRLAPFTLIGATVMLAVSATAMAAMAGRLSGMLRGRFRTLGTPLAWATMVLVVSAVAIDATRTGIAIQRDNHLSPDGLAALTWVRDNTPADALILANTYSEGSIGTIAHRNGYLDGRAPYNKQFDFLLLSVDQMTFARSFYQGETDAAAIAAAGIDYVIVSPDEYALANAHPFCDPVAESNAELPCFATDPGLRPGLTEVARFGSLAIYEVGG